MMPARRNTPYTWAGVALALAGAALSLVSMVTFASLLAAGTHVSGAGWAIYAASVVCWMGGLLLLTRGRETIRQPFPWLLLPIVVLAFVLRVSELGTLPFGVWYDEATYTMAVRRFFAEPGFSPIIQDNATYPHLLLFQLGTRIFGDGDVTAVRIVSALFGVGSVILAFFVGRLLRDDTFGLIFAFILAVMRWSIIFSRIGMTGIDVTFFVLLTFWALIRLGQSGHLGDMLLVAAAVGIGLWFYRAFQLLLVPLGFYLLLVWRVGQGIRRLLTLLLTAMVTLFVFVQPLGVTALYQPGLLFGRVAQTSLFSAGADGGSILVTLLESVRRYLLMFTVAGDLNGRHNLPGSPMLDPVTGVLFAAGLLVGLWQIRRREHLFGFALLGTSLAAGILSMPSEAPHALRTLGGIPMAAYFAALAAYTLLMGLRTLVERAQQTPTVVRAGGVALALALGAPMLWLNYDTYFHLQRTDYRSWGSFSTREAVAARWLLTLPSDVRVIAAPEFDFGLTGAYLAPERLAQMTRLDAWSPLPVRVPAERSVMLLLAASQADLLAEFQQLYPGAVVTPILASDFGVRLADGDTDVLFFSVLLTPENIASVQGLDEGAGILYAPAFGEYAFSIPSAARMTLAGEELSGDVRILLAEGNHAVRISPPDAVIAWRVPGAAEEQPLPAWALYQPMIGESGLLASYFPNADWEGEPSLVRLESSVYRYIHVSSLERPYSALWSGSLYVSAAGTYTLGLRATTESVLAIDGDVVVESNSILGDRAALELAQGWHTVEIRQLVSDDFSRIYFEWMPPGTRTMIPVPGAALRAQ